jgi:hypothetical protein
MFLKLWIFTNLNMVLPAILLVFAEFSEGVLHCHYYYILTEYHLSHRIGKVMKKIRDE